MFVVSDVHSLWCWTVFVWSFIEETWGWIWWSSGRPADGTFLWERSSFQPLNLSCYTHKHTPVTTTTHCIGIVVCLCSADFDHMVFMYYDVYSNPNAILCFYITGISCLGFTDLQKSPLYRKEKSFNKHVQFLRNVLFVFMFILYVYLIFFKKSFN